MKNSGISKISISNFPLELIDIILEKSYLLSILKQWDSSQNQKEEESIKLLASVDFCWFQRITSKRFKNIVWSKLKKLYEDNYKLYLIYKNNLQFFEEFHQISPKTNRNRNRSSKKRQTTIQIPRTVFFLAIKNDVSSSKAFIRYFDYFNPAKQMLIFAIIFKGGGAARVEIKMSLPLTKFKLITQQLEDKETMMLRSLVDRDAVVWIWCLSNNALQKLSSRDGLKKLIEIVHQSVKATSDVLEHKTETNIDCDHLRKKIVRFPLVMVDSRTQLSFDRESKSNNSESNITKVIDVTKLKMKIYVLCLIRSCGLTKDASISTMICVFEDRSPYPIVEEILLKRFNTNTFMSIVSSVTDNCLYLLTSAKNHYVDEVIRVEIKENEESSLLHPSKWLTLEDGYDPYALSISRDGYLMMVNRFSPTVLRTYNRDARINLSVTLHGDILAAYKALETSNGNFIILHFMERPAVDTGDGDRSKGTNEEERHFVGTVSEVSRDGKTITRRFIPQIQQQQFYIRPHYYGGDLFTDSIDRVFVADPDNFRVIILDSCLRWIGTLSPQFKKQNENEKPLRPMKMFFDKDLHEMIITERAEVFIYNLIFT